MRLLQKLLLHPSFFFMCFMIKIIERREKIAYQKGAWEGKEKLW